MDDHETTAEEVIDYIKGGELARGLLLELLHVADNGFLAPEARDAKIRRIRLAARTGGLLS